MAIVELVTDQLPRRRAERCRCNSAPGSSSGALSGATIGAAAGSWIIGLIAGVIGAVIGTYGGAEIRARMAAAFGRDQPAAFIEDAGAIILGLIIIWALR